MTNKTTFLLEAFKITLFCLLSTGIFILIGANETTVLVLFNIAVMSAAATFSPQRKRLMHLTEGCLVITVSIVMGGVLGFYFPLLSKIIAILYASLAFWIPKTKFQSNIFVTGSLMFLIFAALPFSFTHALTYSTYALLLLVIYLLLHLVIDRHIYPNVETSVAILNKRGQQLGLICLISMSLAVGIALYLHYIQAFSHLYWIGLTVLVILQSSSQGAIKIACLRIGINALGAILIVIVMSTLMPAEFWVNFAFLTALLFAIFAFGYSYFVRTLCIELFVLSFTHLLGSYHNTVPIDRIILTLIGGGLVIMITLLIQHFYKLI